MSDNKENKNNQSVSFDVFLCHNSDDKDEIRHIADELIKREIKPWLDEREIPPGTSWQSVLEEQIANIRSVAVFIGRNGIGPWQKAEIRAFINEFVERECPVIPVILLTAEKVPSLPIFLKNLHYVDFRVPEPDPWLQIQWGITGKKPVSLTLSKSECGDFQLIDSYPKKDQKISTNDIKKIFLKFNKPIDRKSVLYIGNHYIQENTFAQWNVFGWIQFDEDDTKLIWHIHEHVLSNKNMHGPLDIDYPRFEIHIGREPEEWRLKDIYGNFLPQIILPVTIKN